MKTFILSWPSGREEYHCEQEALDRLKELAGEDVTALRYTVDHLYLCVERWPPPAHNNQPQCQSLYVWPRLQDS
jgi:hypothetical protein